MPNVVATTLAAMIDFVVALFVQLLSWMEMHRYAYLIWKAALSGPSAV